MKAEKESPIDKRTNALGAVDPMPSLPAEGRKLGISTRLALEFAGVAAVATGVAGCVFQFSGNRETPSPNPTPIATPSSSPTGTPEITIVPSPTAEVSPTLSPEAKLKQDMAAFLNPDTKLPDTGRVYLFEDSKAPLPLGLFQTSALDYSQPIAEASFQGYLIGTATAENTDGTEYLIAYMGQESAPSTDGANNRYILKLDLGRLDTSDKTDITIGGVVFNSPPSSQQTELEYSTFETENELSKYNGHFAIFSLDVITGTGSNIGFAANRNPEDESAQNATAKAVIEFSKLTSKEPFNKVPMTNLVKGAIITDAANISFDEQNFDPSTIPLTLSTYVSTTP